MPKIQGYFEVVLRRNPHNISGRNFLENIDKIIDTYRYLKFFDIYITDLLGVLIRKTLI